jgi:hypothetical protein
MDAAAFVGILQVIVGERMVGIEDVEHATARTVVGVPDPDDLLVKDYIIRHTRNLQQLRTRSIIMG